MSEHVTLDAPAPSPPLPPPPGWLRRKFLDPNEQVIWWQGPTLRPWRAWFETHQDRLFLAAWGATFLLPNAIWFVGPGGAFFGACFGVGLLMAVALIAGAGDKFRWQILTDRRLLVVVGQKKTEEFDLALLRQLLGSAGAAGALPASEQVIDLSKVGAIGGSSQGVTDLASVLAMAKLMQQVQGAGKVSAS
jgi:hypothetical protein